MEYEERHADRIRNFNAEASVRSHSCSEDDPIAAGIEEGSSASGELRNQQERALNKETSAQSG